MTRDTNIEMVVGGGLGMGDVGWGELVDTNIEMEGNGGRATASRRPKAGKDWPKVLLMREKVRMRPPCFPFFYPRDGLRFFATASESLAAFPGAHRRALQ